MTEKRLKQILNNIIIWGYEHSDKFIQHLINSMKLTPEEAMELELEDWVKCPEDEPQE